MAYWQIFGNGNQVHFYRGIANLTDSEKSQPSFGRFYRLPPGSANSQPKFPSKKLAKAFSKKILQSTS
jgi:serum/glucocorticoid-regulated kinase 2